jgi:hypothetical protein
MELSRPKYESLADYSTLEGLGIRPIDLKLGKLGVKVVRRYRT